MWSSRAQPTDSATASSGDTIDSISNNGAITSASTLANDFFEAPATFDAQGMAGLLRHLAGDTANALDTHIVEDLRSFLNDPPDATDLAATNIQRGRDLGLGTLNETRVALGLTPYTSFDQITSDSTTAAALQQAYGSVDNVDLWTGGLAEDHVPGAALGQTFDTIIANQFIALRDGDRFYFQNQFASDPTLLNQIENTTLSDIIERNTDTGVMQADAFVATERHSGVAGGVDPHGADAAPGEAQLVIGSPGTDQLFGGPNNDTLVAAQGNMTMTGGGGADTFVFDPKQHTAATVTDWVQGDTLNFGTDVHQINLKSDGNGGTMVMAGAAHVDLVGVQVSTLAQAVAGFSVASMNQNGTTTLVQNSDISTHLTLHVQT